MFDSEGVIYEPFSGGEIAKPFSGGEIGKPSTVGERSTSHPQWGRD